MASATYLQSLNVLNADGTDIAGFPSNRRQVESFIAGDVIAANDLVALDLSASSLGKQAVTIIKADKNTDAKCIAIGFALNAAAAAGDTVEVTIAGIHESANVHVDAAAGKPLTVSTVAGRAAIYANSDTQTIVAYAMAADTANVGPVFVIKQF